MGWGPGRRDSQAASGSSASLSPKAFARARTLAWSANSTKPSTCALTKPPLLGSSSPLPALARAASEPVPKVGHL